MDKDKIVTALSVAGILTLSIIANHLTRNDRIKSTSNNASEKTAALTKLFETDAFKNGTSYDQKRLIEAIDRMYL